MRKRTGALLFILASVGVAGALYAQGQKPATFVLRFVNGDSLHVRPVGLEKGRFSFVADMAPGRTLTVSSKQIAEITCNACATERKKTDDTLALRDGSALRGTFEALATDLLRFQVAGLGELSIPRTGAESLVRGGGDVAPPLEPGQHHVVTTRQGDILIGALLPGPKGRLVVQGQELTATVGYGSVRSIHFPTADTAGEKAAPDAKAPAAKTASDGKTAPRPTSRPVRLSVSLRNGTRLIGTDATMSAGKLSLTIAGGTRVTIAEAALHELAFMGSGSQAEKKAILMWGRYADRYQEFKRTAEVLRKAFPGWKLEEDFSDDFDAKFRAKLAGARTLVIPEMERWRSPRFRRSSVKDPKALARNLRRVAIPFLRRGGNIIIMCPSRYQTDFFREAGLIDVRATSNRAKVRVPFTPAGRTIARGLGASFVTPNATQFYKLGASIPAQEWARHKRGSPLIGRRVGSGWVVLLGMDFFKKNAKTEKLLSNATNLR